jgi:hypothetical protein
MDFPPDSRYAATPTAVLRTADGREIRYLLDRPPVDAPVQDRHTVVEHDRLDLLADRAYDDPTQFWRICDGNRAMWPDDLTATVGSALDIPSALAQRP